MYIIRLYKINKYKINNKHSYIYRRKIIYNNKLKNLNKMNFWWFNKKNWVQKYQPYRQETSMIQMSLMKKITYAYFNHYKKMKKKIFI